MNTYSICPKDIENIWPVPHNPALTHKRPFTVSIAANKNTSVLEDPQATEQIKVYSDGSSQEGNVGAAATIYRNGEATRTLHLLRSSKLTSERLAMKLQANK